MTARFMNRRRAWLVGLAVIAVLALLPVLLPPYLQGVATRVLIFALLAMSLDLMYGYAGLWSLGHAAFFGVGGYTVALLMVERGVTSFWVGAGLGVLAAAVASAILGVVALRVRGIYFILVTFALGQMLASLAQQWDALQTSGAEAVVGIVPPEITPFVIDWSAEAIYYFVAVVVILAALALSSAVRSPFGDVLLGIRENEGRMSALGYNVWLYKYAAFVVAGAFAGLAGVLFVYQAGLIAPTNLGVAQSGLVMLMVILGGAGTLWGPALGAAIVVLVQYYASDLAPAREDLILGLLFLVTLLVFRGGVLPGLRALSKPRETTG
jgi:branched-chain amino acid transport system permease protein